MPKPAAAPAHCDLDLRVRYAECDPMGYAHHAAYPVWFEMTSPH